MPTNRQPCGLFTGAPLSTVYRLLSTAFEIVKRFAPEVEGGVVQLLVDAEEAVILGDALAARRSAGLDLARVRADHDIGDRRVLGLAAPVGDHRGETGPLGHLDRGERLRQRADLVDLDQARV